jgi:hypothetical protein
MKKIWLINWDNGGDACGTFPWEYETEEAAQADADSIEAENLAQDIWAEDGYCEVISIERYDEDDIEQANADYEQSAKYFDRYIAGDR